MSNVLIRMVHGLTQVLDTQVSRDTTVQVNPNANITLLGLGISQE